MSSIDDVKKHTDRILDLFFTTGLFDFTRQPEVLHLGIVVLAGYYGNIPTSGPLYLRARRVWEGAPVELTLRAFYLASQHSLLRVLYPNDPLDQQIAHSVLSKAQMRSPKEAVHDDGDML